MNKNVDMNRAVVVKQSVDDVRANAKGRVSQRKLISGLVLCIIVVVAIGIGLEVNSKNITNYGHETNTLNGFITTDNCSNQAQQSVRSNKPNRSQIKYSISLLSYRALCFETNGNYEQANVQLEQLKMYYKIENSTVNVANVDLEIESNTAAEKIKPGPKATSTPVVKPDISAAQAQELQDFYGKSQ